MRSTDSPTDSPSAPPTVSPTVAIVGGGPSGCYTAQFLRKQWPDAEITIFDRLDTPHGLVRYGVAPDHLGTKAIARQFDRLFARDGVVFVGGTEVGASPTVDELRDRFDIVVLATGLAGDRLLDGIDHTIAGVHGSGYLTRLINGHPDEDASGLDVGRRVVVVGMGNVAIDVVRLLLTPAETLRRLGVADSAVAALTSGPLERIDVVARGAAPRSKFDVAMLKELAASPDVRFEATGLDAVALAAEAVTESDAAAAMGAAKVEAVRALVAGSSLDAGRTVAFHFACSPVRVTGDTRVTGLVVADEGGERTIGADTVVTAVGFVEHAGSVIRRAAHESGDSDLSVGRLARGLYCVGWLRRGPVGTIPANRADAKLVADTIVADSRADRRGDPAMPVDSVSAADVPTPTY